MTRNYLMTRSELERLVQDSVEAYRTNAVDTSRVHRASRARTFRRGVLRTFLDANDPNVVFDATTGETHIA